ncbi:predicted protein [Aspergillus nidulans FGSC A4]|nr:predicted protein [Aspergillus nidulans FGSC A4]|eukprot:XP_664344.1 predicted protein [Aspergillus nidulans FGSC A4]
MTSLWNRKRDLVYFGFFAIHIPIIFLVDAVPVLPGLLDNAVSRQLRDFYTATYRDKFFEDSVPAWFTSYIWMEILYHVPLSIWALGALLRVIHHILDLSVRGLVVGGPHRRRKTKFNRALRPLRCAWGVYGLRYVRADSVEPPEAGQVETGVIVSAFSLYLPPRNIIAPAEHLSTRASHTVCGAPILYSNIDDCEITNE